MIIKIHNNLINTSIIDAICTRGETGMVIHTPRREYEYKFDSQRDRNEAIQMIQNVLAEVHVIREINLPGKTDYLAGLKL